MVSGCGYIFHHPCKVYTKVIYSTLIYSALAWYIPSRPGEGPRKIAKDITVAQLQELRVVAGTYKATYIQELEHKTNVPPIDLYLNKRVADFKGCLKVSGMAQLIRNTSIWISTCLRKNRPLRPGQNALPPPKPQAGVSQVDWADGW